MTRTTYNGTSRRNKFKGTVDNDILIGGDGIIAAQPWAVFV